MHHAPPDLKFKNVHYNIKLKGCDTGNSVTKSKTKKKDRCEGQRGGGQRGQWSGPTRSSLRSSLHGLRTATINCWCCVCSSQRLFCQRNAGLGSRIVGRRESAMAENSNNRAERNQCLPSRPRRPAILVPRRPVSQWPEHVGLLSGSLKGLRGFTQHCQPVLICRIYVYILFHLTASVYVVLSHHCQRVI